LRRAPRALPFRPRSRLRSSCPPGRTRRRRRAIRPREKRGVTTSYKRWEGVGEVRDLCNVRTAASGLALRYDGDVGTSETLRSVTDAGRNAKRLDELSAARVILKIAEQVHAAQQKAGAGKAIGPITPSAISIDVEGHAKLGLAEPTAYGYSSPEQLS